MFSIYGHKQIVIQCVLNSRMCPSAERSCEKFAPESDRCEIQNPNLTVWDFSWLHHIPNNQSTCTATRWILLIHQAGFLLWLPYGIGQTIIFSSCGFFFYLSLFSCLISAATDWMSRILPHTVWLSANLRCRSEMCCKQLTANTGCKKVAKNRHLGSIAQLRLAISSQLRHVSTIEKKTC